MFHTPPLEAPDELPHLLYMTNLRESGTLPILAENRQTILASQAVLRHHPPLYYMFGALLLNLTPFSAHDFTQYRHANPIGSIGVVDINNQNVYLHPAQDSADFLRAIYLLRGANLFISALTLWLIYRIGCALGDKFLGLLGAAMAGCIPTFLFISGSINNDALSSFFYTAGLCWLIERWQARTLNIRHILLISLILAGSALTKINGLSLFGLIYSGLLFGVAHRRWRWYDALVGIAISAFAVLLVAGWWYWRNIQLYGEPLAIEATSQIWGRVAAPQFREIGGVWVSFWGIFGHFNIRAPEWLFYYAGVLTIGGLSGALLYTWRQASRASWLILWAVLALVMATVYVATQRINISQGRLLYPMIGAFAILIAQGWRVWISRPLPRALILLPLLLAAFMTSTWLNRAYQPLSIGEIPDDAVEIIAKASDFILRAYQIPQTVNAQDTLTMRVWFNLSQQPDADYALGVVVLDGRTGEVHGNAIIYPGMVRTSTLSPLEKTTYMATLQVPLNAAMPFAPNQSRIELRWIRITRLDEQVTMSYTIWHDGENNALNEHLVLSGPSIIAPDYIPPIPSIPLQLAMGDSFLLEGVTFSAESIHAGQSLDIGMRWAATGQIPESWLLTVQILDAHNNLLTQADAPPLGYATNTWQIGYSFEEKRTLVIPDTAPVGDYRVAIGWYRGDIRLDGLHEIGQIRITE